MKSKQIRNVAAQHFFRPRNIAEMTSEMRSSWDMTKRRLREGVEFFRFLRARAA